MKRSLIATLCPIVLLGLGLSLTPDGRAASVSGVPRYTKDGNLIFPSDYRSWTFVTSGMGMSYSAAAQMSMDPAFDNVFVPTAAYQRFVETGHWPDKTMWVIEVRRSTGKGSINKAGRFQREVLGYDVEVKDPGTSETWRYYGFGPQNGAPENAKAFPQSAGCFECHSKNGAVEHTFVQFYPTLLDVAKQKGTINASYREE
jgi:hypothetical protein